jgi:hypothetical protein
MDDYQANRRAGLFLLLHLKNVYEYSLYFSGSNAEALCFLFKNNTKRLE